MKVLRFVSSRVAAAVVVGVALGLPTTGAAATPTWGPAARDTLVDTGLPGRLYADSSVVDRPEDIKNTLDNIGRREIPGETAWQRHKNPKVAMLCSALMPGLGQLYNGRRIKVGVAAGAFWFYAANMYLSNATAQMYRSRRDQFAEGSKSWVRFDILVDFWKEDARTYLWWTGATWLFVFLDSWIDAHLYDLRSYTPPAVSAVGPVYGQEERTHYLTLNFGF